ncbi:MAG: hypothetical protein PHT07_24230 [Paludibacter sp.]|nr:hypothetical protein [Paludibacter sp.]
MKRPVMFFAVGLALAFNSCQKNDISNLEGDAISSLQETPLEVSLIETEIDEALSDVDLLADEAVNIQASILRSAAIDSSVYLSDCPTITVDKNVMPQVMTIDFGTACSGKDGKLRSGKIIVKASTFRSFPTRMEKTFDNYYVNGKKIEGLIRKFVVKDSLNHSRIAIVNEDVTIIFPERHDTAHHVTDMTRRYLRNVPEDRTDDQNITWGKVENTRPSGFVSTKMIAERTPLVYQVSCKHIVSGIASFRTSRGRHWTIDYGDGSCDN